MPPPDILPPAPPAAPARLRLAARRLGRLLGLLAALLVGVAAVALHDLDRQARGALLGAAHDLEAQIGRPVTIGAVRVSLGWTTEIVVHDLTIAAPPGAAGELATPLLRVPTARLAVGLGKLARSRGTAIEVARFALDSPELTLVRTASGLSIDDIRARLASAPAAAPSAPRTITIASLAIAGARLRLITPGAPAGADLVIGVGGSDLHLDGSRPARLSVEAAAREGGARATIAIDLAAPAVAGAPSLALRRIKARIDGFPVAPLLAFARTEGPRGLDLSAVTLGADLEVEPGARITARGRIDLAGLRLDGVAEPVGASLGAALTIEPSSAAIGVQDLDLRLGGVGVRGSLRAHGLGPDVTVDESDLIGTAEASALLALVPPDRRPAGVTFAGPVSLALRGAGSGAGAHATLSLDLAELRPIAIDPAGHATAGLPARLALTAALAFSREDGLLHLGDLDLRLGDLSLRGQADLGGLTAPERAPSIESLLLDAGGPIEQVLALAPAARLPPGVALQGAFSASIAARRAGEDLQGRGSLDLGQARVRAAAFAKAAGVPCRADLEGRVGPSGATVTRGDLRLGSLVAVVRGKSEGAGRGALSFDARGATLASLLALFPGAAERLGGASIDGKLALKGTLRRAPDLTAVEVTARVEEARLQRGNVSIGGAPEITVRAEVKKGELSARTEIDLGAAAIHVGPYFTKRAGRPASLAFALRREGDRVRVRDARLAFPGLTVEGLELSSEPGHLHLTAAASIALGPLLDGMPLLAFLPPGVSATTARFQVDLDGDPDHLDAATLRLPSAEVTSGFGHLRGSLRADGLPPRSLRVEVLGGDLDLGDASAAPASTDKDTSGIRLSAHVHLDSIQARGQTVRALDTDLALDAGRLLVDRLHAEALGGTIDVEKSWVELATSAFDLHAAAAGLDLARLPGETLPELRGKASGRVDLGGEGSQASALRGTLSLALRDLHARPTVHPTVSLVNPILAELAAHHAASPAPQRDLDLSQVSVAFDVGGGKLTTRAPLVVRSSAFEASLQGQIGFDRSLALQGQVEVAAAAIEKATEGKLRPPRPLPLRLKVSGDTRALRVELIELRESFLALRGKE